MRLYYGSSTNFTSPEFGKGNTTNDYGLGFYMTDSYELARLWASKFTSGGYVLTFDIDLNGLEILNIADDSELNVLRWITLLINHRFRYQDKEKYIDKIKLLDKKFHVSLNFIDFVIGCRADDSYFNYSKDFVSDDLSFEILSKAMKVGSLGLQYVAISKKAFKRLKFVKSEKIEHTNEYNDFQKKTLDEYLALKSHDKITNTYLRDILRKYDE